jgi:lysophospholipase L1-like esterase/dienelactone hydrolase
LLETTGYTVQNDGVGGTTMLKNGNSPYWKNGKLAQVFTFKPNIVTIALGTNDTKQKNWDTYNTEFKGDYLAMIDTLNTLATKPRIYLVLPPPIWTNTFGIRDSALQKIIAIVKQIALERGLPIIDCNTPLKSSQAFFADGVHPNAVGADTIAHIIYRSIIGSPAMRFQFCSYSSTEGTLPFRLFLPENYSRTERYPLILALHGAGECGSDNIEQISGHRVAEIWAEDTTQAKQKCFVAAPQCPSSGQWVNVPTWNQMYYSTTTMAQSGPLTLALKVLDSLIKVYPIDTNRLYITGLSMGGYGTWDIITRHPGKFAAAIPLSGGNDTSKASVLTKTPIWAFHGAVDGTVPPQADRSMFANIKAGGESVVSYTATYTPYFGTPTITRDTLATQIGSGATKLYGEYTNGGHDIWTDTYNDPLLAEWLFKQVKPLPAVAELSEGRTAYASSTQNGHDPTNAVDDNPATRWNAINGTYPQWWMVDLGERADLTSMQIQWYRGASGSDNRVYAYKIEVSDDRLDGFTTIADRTNNDRSGSTEDLFPPATRGRFVKITIGNVVPAGAYAAIIDAKVYGQTQVVGIVKKAVENSEAITPNRVQFSGRDLMIPITRPGCSTVTIYNLAGRIMLQQAARGPGNLRLDPRNLHGMVVVSVKSGSQLLFHKQCLFP